MRSLLGAYSESSYDANSLLKNVKIAIERATLLDTNKKQRWPQNIGTRVYKLVDNILKECKSHKKQSKRKRVTI